MIAGILSLSLGVALALSLICTVVALVGLRWCCQDRDAEIAKRQRLENLLSDARQTIRHVETNSRIWERVAGERKILLADIRREVYRHLSSRLPPMGVDVENMTDSQIARIIRSHMTRKARS